MSRRLIVTGLACPPSAWERLFPSEPGQRILSLAEVISLAPTPDYREWTRVVVKAWKEFQPTSVVCHDIGLTVALLALLRLQKNDGFKPVYMTLFNGAFRGFNTLKARHPIQIQFMNYRSFQSTFEDAGGEVDSRFELLFPIIKSFYKKVAFQSLTELWKHKLFRIPYPKISFKSRFQIIASPNDPFIPMSSINQLRKDLPNPEYHEVSYGHFPYSIQSEHLSKIVCTFEKS